MSTKYNKLAIKLVNGNFAIIQTFGKIGESIEARVGFIKPGMNCLEYIDLNNWSPDYKGSTTKVNDWLKSEYSRNSVIIKKRLLSMA